LRDAPHKVLATSEHMVECLESCARAATAFTADALRHEAQWHWPFPRAFCLSRT
jgi:hypothetical protein